MMHHAVVYAIAGIVIEFLFTGMHSLLILRSLKAETRSYLWMPIIYGVGGLALEAAHIHMVLVPLIVRIIIMTVLLYIIEYMSGWALEVGTGACPWRYTGSNGEIHPRSISGYVRIDYIPYWFILMLIFDLTLTRTGWAVQ